MLKLKKGTVVSVTAERAGYSEFITSIDGIERAAMADTDLLGPVMAGDAVVVNTEAVELKLGSGGRDVMIVNLSRGLGAEVAGESHVMKLNYCPLQHAVAPIELDQPSTARADRSVCIVQLHGQLAPAVWSAMQAEPNLRIGYIQTAGGALPGAMSTVVQTLLATELLCGHVTVAPAYGGRLEAISLVGALDAVFAEHGWDAAIVGPGPGILGSSTAFGHGGMVALDSIHAVAAAGCKPILAVRASSGDARPRHQGVSHHTRTVLALALAQVVVAVADPGVHCPEFDRHQLLLTDVDLDGYGASGLPAVTMGRNLSDDSVFFEQALAAGKILAQMSNQQLSSDTESPGNEGS